MDLAPLTAVLDQAKMTDAWAPKHSTRGITVTCDIIGLWRNRRHAAEHAYCARTLPARLTPSSGDRSIRVPVTVTQSDSDNIGARGGDVTAANSSPLRARGRSDTGARGADATEALPGL